MNKKEVIQEIKELNKELLEYSKVYYETGETLVSDEVYDAQIDRLKDLLKLVPDVTFENIITEKVGSEIQENNMFKKVKHDVPMLSLDNAFDQDNMTNFYKDTNLDEFSVEHKIDGVSISIPYENGKMVKAITRGDGKIGEDVTHTIKTIKNVPHTISEKNKVTVRGEVYLPIAEFDRINRELEKKGEREFKNPRNTVAGVMRRKDSSSTNEIGLKIAFYDLVEKDELNVKSQKELFDFLKKHKLPYLDTYKILKKNQVEKYIENVEVIREKLPYQIDGVVIKINDFEERKRLGFTSKYPKWAIAYKLKSEEVETILEDIWPSIGRTGKVTYNAKLLGVKLQGSTISAATLHNFEYVKNLGLRKGDKVIIKKAGDVIPKVIRRVENYNNSAKLFERILVCPHCESNLEAVEGMVDQFCLSTDCDEKKIRQLIRSVDRDNLNIPSVSSAIVKNLYERGIVKKLSDVLVLKNKAEELKKLPGFGEKSVSNILKEIENARENWELRRLLSSLGISGLGRSASRDLAKKYPTIEEIFNLSIEDIENIENFGNTTAKAIYEFFHNDENKKEVLNIISKLKPLKVKKLESDVLKGKLFLFTGSLSTKRDDWKKIVDDNSGRVSSSLSSKLDYLVVGDKPSPAKLEKANKLGIKIITEKEMNELLKKKEKTKKIKKELSR